MDALTRVVAMLAVLLGSACERPALQTGAECSLNSDCASPLICGLERCRRQCIDSRDCGAGLQCLAIGEMGGVCQLADEVNCSLTSQCGGSLVCRFGTCTTECVEDRDCTPGASCERDAESGDNACVEPLTELCIYNSDCPAPLVCGPLQQCMLECRERVDCPRNRMCIANLCELPDGG